MCVCVCQRLAKELQRQELEREKSRRREVELRKQEAQLASEGARIGDSFDGTEDDLVYRNPLHNIIGTRLN